MPDPALSPVWSRIDYGNSLLTCTPNCGNSTGVERPILLNASFSELHAIKTAHLSYSNSDHWLPISERIKYKTACMCYNAITGSAPAYPSELLHLYRTSRSLRSSSDTRMLKIQRFNRKTHGFRTFSHFGPHIWNNLPQDIRHSATLSSFKSQLKTFLFSEYFS